ncbi:hypothetical protein HDV00_007619 [Rhizophlyctis rosea]|nr:hypothetical protein HDV00_007619 [Rhizophlyctis rosea]
MTLTVPNLHTSFPTTPHNPISALLTLFLPSEILITRLTDATKLRTDLAKHCAAGSAVYIMQFNVADEKDKPAYEWAWKDLYENGYWGRTEGLDTFFVGGDADGWIVGVMVFEGEAMVSKDDSYDAVMGILKRQQSRIGQYTSSDAPLHPHTNTTPPTSPYLQPSPAPATPQSSTLRLRRLRRLNRPTLDLRIPEMEDAFANYDGSGGILDGWVGGSGGSVSLSDGAVGGGGSEEDSFIVEEFDDAGVEGNVRERMVGVGERVGEDGKGDVVCAERERGERGVVVDEGCGVTNSADSILGGTSMEVDDGVPALHLDNEQPTSNHFPSIPSDANINDAPPQNNDVTLRTDASTDRIPSTPTEAVVVVGATSNPDASTQHLHSTSSNLIITNTPHQIRHKRSPPILSPSNPIILPDSPPHQHPTNTPTSKIKRPRASTKTHTTRPTSRPPTTRPTSRPPTTSQTEFVDLATTPDDPPTRPRTTTDVESRMTSVMETTVQKIKEVVAGAESSEGVARGVWAIEGHLRVLVEGCFGKRRRFDGRRREGGSVGGLRLEGWGGGVGSADGAVRRGEGGEGEGFATVSGEGEVGVSSVLSVRWDQGKRRAVAGESRMEGGGVRSADVSLSRDEGDVLATVLSESGVRGSSVLAVSRGNDKRRAVDGEGRVEGGEERASESFERARKRRRHASTANQPSVVVVAPTRTPNPIPAATPKPRSPPSPSAQLALAPDATLSSSPSSATRKISSTVGTTRENSVEITSVVPGPASRSRSVAGMGRPTSVLRDVGAFRRAEGSAWGVEVGGEERRRGGGEVDRNDIGGSQRSCREEGEWRDGRWGREYVSLVKIPEDKIGLVIGYKGRTVKGIEEQFCVKIRVCELWQGEVVTKVVSIVGRGEEGKERVGRARRRVLVVIGGERSGVVGGHGGGYGGGGGGGDGYGGGGGSGYGGMHGFGGGDGSGGWGGGSGYGGGWGDQQPERRYSGGAERPSSGARRPQDAPSASTPVPRSAERMSSSGSYLSGRGEGGNSVASWFGSETPRPRRDSTVANRVVRHHLGEEWGGGDGRSVRGGFLESSRPSFGSQSDGWGGGWNGETSAMIHNRLPMEWGTRTPRRIPTPPPINWGRPRRYQARSPTPPMPASHPHYGPGLSDGYIGLLPIEKWNEVKRREGVLNGCAISLDVYQDEEDVMQLGCQHMYHSFCSTTWFKINGVCPILSAELLSAGLCLVVPKQAVRVHDVMGDEEVGSFEKTSECTSAPDDSIESGSVLHNPSPVPFLPLEIVRVIARLSYPRTTQLMRRACKAWRNVIVEGDVVWAGWRTYTRGFDDCWQWASQWPHHKILHAYMKDSDAAKREWTLNHSIMKDTDLPLFDALLQAGVGQFDLDGMFQAAAYFGQVKLVKRCLECRTPLMNIYFYPALDMAAQLGESLQTQASTILALELSTD